MIFGAAKARASEPADDFSAFKVIPSSGEFVHLRSASSYCGRKTSLYVFQMRTDDIYRAAKETSQLLDRFSAESPMDGCPFAIVWQNGIGKQDRQIRVTRWIDESQLIAFSKQTRSLGIPQNINEYPLFALADRSVFPEIEALRSKMESDPTLAGDEGRRRLMKDTLEDLERKETAYATTRNKVLVNVILVQPSAISSTSRESAYKPARQADRRPFPSIRSALHDASASIRRQAASDLLDWAEQASREAAPMSGIGIKLAATSEGIVINEVIKGLPAEEARLTTGTLILSVNGNPIADKPLAAIPDLIRGPAGSRVTLGYKAPGRTEKLSVTLIRKTLTPSVEEIASTGNECSTDSDRTVNLLCLAVVGRTGSRQASANAAKKAAESLTDPDQGVREAALTALEQAWGRSARSEMSAPLPRDPNSEEACRASNDCNVAHSKECLVFPTYYDWCGYKAISFSSMEKSYVATFPFSMENAAHQITFGPFCDLTPGRYMETITGCSGINSFRSIYVTTGTRSLNLCLMEQNRMQSLSSPGDLPWSSLRTSSITARMDVVLSTPPPNTRWPNPCPGLSWTLGGKCVVKDPGHFYREAVIPLQDTRFTVQNCPSSPCLPARLTISVRLTHSTAAATIPGMELGTEQWLGGKIKIPDLRKPDIARSTDGVVEVKSQIYGVTPTAEELGSSAVKSQRKSVLAASSPHAYRVRISSADFVFTSTAPLAFTYSQTHPQSKPAIYRFDGLTWSSGTITSQRVRSGPRKGTVRVSGEILRSGLYATFSPGKDTKPPVTTFSIVGSSKSSQGAMLVSIDSWATLKASDRPQNGFASEVATTYYRIDKLNNEDPFQVYVSSIPLDLGPHVLEYRSQDWAGNMEAVKVASFVVTAGDIFQSSLNRVVTGNVLVGFLNYGARFEVQSAAQNSYTFMISSADAIPLMTATNIGSVGLGVLQPQAILDIGTNGRPIAMQVRGGGSPASKEGARIAFGFNGSDAMRHVVLTRHGPHSSDNGIDFMVWNQRLSTEAAANRAALSVQGGETAGKGAVQICPAGLPDAELEVSDGRSLGGGTTRRLEAQTPGFAGAVPREDVQALMRRQAYDDVMALRPARYRGATGSGRGLIATEAPQSIQGGNGVVLLDTRVANLELALQESIAKLARLEQRLRDLQRKGR